MDYKRLGDEYKNKIEELVHIRREATSMLRLKFRKLWLEEGDKNSRYFHNAIKDRQRLNSITFLEGKEGRMEGVANIKEEVKNYFNDFFKEEEFLRPVPEGLEFDHLSENEARWC